MQSKLASETTKAHALQGKFDAVQRQLEARAAELSEAMEMLAQLQQGQLSGSSVASQLQIDKEKLARQVAELESDQSM